MEPELRCTNVQHQTKPNLIQPNQKRHSHQRNFLSIPTFHEVWHFSCLYVIIIYYIYAILFCKLLSRIFDKWCNYNTDAGYIDQFYIDIQFIIKSLPREMEMRKAENTGQNTWRWKPELIRCSFCTCIYQIQREKMLFPLFTQPFS